MKDTRVKFNVDQGRLQQLEKIIKFDTIYQGELNHCCQYANGKFEAYIEYNFTWDKIIQIMIKYTHYNKFATRVYFSKL